MSCNLTMLLCKMGIHNMDIAAHWMDKDYSIGIAEYKCSRCDKVAYDFVHFIPAECRVLTRVTDSTENTVTECEKVESIGAKKSKPRTRSTSKEKKAAN